MKICLFLLLPFAVFGQSISGPQLSADLRYLQRQLDRHHPNLYLYTPQQAFRAFVDSLEREMPATMTEEDAYGHLARLCSRIRDGHTLFFPSNGYIARHNEGSAFLPLKVFWDGEKLFVELNYAATDEIPNGAEIVRLNGRPAGSVMRHCLDRMMRDGAGMAYPTWVLHAWFSEYYSYFFGHPEVFDIEYRMEEGPVLHKSLRALPKSIISTNRAKRYPGRSFSRVFDVMPGQGITLKIDPAAAVAVLTIRDFDNQNLRRYYHQDFKKTLRALFTSLKTQPVAGLIVDLRGNQGGDLKNGQLLLAYLLDKPFNVVESYAQVRDPSADNDARNKPCGGPGRGSTAPHADAFRGKLAVLTDGGSFSNSGIVCSALRFYKRGALIGQETGGNPHVLTGFEKIVVLPETHIKVHIPTRRFNIREPHLNNGRGLTPDIEVTPTISDLLEGRDAVMEKAVEWVKNAPKRP